MDDLKTRFKNTLFLQLYAFFKIPLLAWVRPQVLENSTEKTVLKLPLSRRTKNHLNVMYFGALGMGAEACIALKAVQAIEKSGQRIDFIFKDFQAQFLKRAESDVHFTCDQGREVEALLQKAIASKERETQTFRSYATTPDKTGNEVVAEFKVTLSIKLRQKKTVP